MVFHPASILLVAISSSAPEECPRDTAAVMDFGIKFDTEEGRREPGGAEALFLGEKIDASVTFSWTGNSSAMVAVGLAPQPAESFNNYVYWVAAQESKSAVAPASVNREGGAPQRALRLPMEKLPPPVSTRLP